MEDTNYSQRELDHFFTDLKSDIKEIKDVLNRVEQQTTRTNGRVTKLEYWRTGVVWGVGVLAAVGTIVVNKLL